MVDIDLPNTLTTEFISLIPEQRAQVNNLLQEGRISSYTLALDRSKLWATFLAESQEEVMDILSTFPLIRYMDINIHELAFHQMANLALPAISLN